MRYALFLLAAAIATPAVAVGMDTPTSATAEKPKKKAKKVCRESHDTTSRMGGGRLCLTNEQWAERDKQGKAGSSRSSKSDSADK